MRLLILSVISSFLSFYADAITYTSISNGSWAGVGTWDSNGIPPPNLLIGNSIVINHNVLLNGNKTIGGSLTINPGKFLSGGSFNIIITGTVSITTNASLICNDISFPTNGLGTLNNSGTISCEKMKVEPGGSALCTTKPVVNNTGTINASDEINIGNGDGCGSLINSGSGIITTPKLHNDGYICNSSTINATDEFILHGGTIECCGNVLTPEFKVEENDNRPGKSNCQNFCTASAFEGGVMPDLNGITVSQATNGVSNSDAVIVVPGTTWCTYAALPIELISFTLKPLVDRKVELGWITSSEINNDYFTLERSLNGQQWEVIAQIAGAGNSTELLEYSFIDENPLFGVSYYRLKQTDYDGEKNYSQILSYTQENDKLGIMELYPNPVENILTVIIQTQNEQGLVIIESINGKEVYAHKIFGSGIHQVYFDMETFSNGMYFVKFSDSQSTSVMTIVKK